MTRSCTSQRCLKKKSYLFVGSGSKVFSLVQEVQGNHFFYNAGFINTLISVLG